MEYATWMDSVPGGAVGSLVRLRLRDVAKPGTVVRGTVVSLNGTDLVLQENATTVRAYPWKDIDDIQLDGLQTATEEETPSLAASSTTRVVTRRAGAPAAPRAVKEAAVTSSRPLPEQRAGVDQPTEYTEARQGAMDPYLRAKDAEHRDKDPVQTEHWLRVTIHQGGPRLPSAVKDLAWLMAVQDRFDESLELLDAHDARYQGWQRESLENLRITILSRARLFTDAARLCGQLAARAKNGRRVSLRHQQAVLLRAAGDLTGATKAATEVLTLRPDHQDAIRLLEQLTSRISPADLSEMAQFVLQSASRRGLSSQSRERGIYDDDDVLNIQTELALTGEDQPRIRGELLLTLGYLAFEAVDAVRQDPLELLRQAMLYFARAAYEDGLLDSSRAFAVEALLLCVRDGSRVDRLDEALTVLAASYLLSGERAVETMRRHKEPTLVLEELRIDPAHSAPFVADLAAYAASSPDLTDAIVRRSRQLPALATLLESETAIRAAWFTERQRFQSEKAYLDKIRERGFAVDAFHEVASQLQQTAVTTRFETDRRYLKELSGTLSLAGVDDLNRERPSDVLAAHERADVRLSTLIEQITLQPTRLAIEQTLPLARAARDVIRGYRSDLVVRARPILTTRDLLEHDHYVQRADGTIDVALELSSDEGGVAITDVRIVIQATPAVRPSKTVVQIDRLCGGERRELTLSLSLSRVLTSAETITVVGRVQYHVPLTQRAGQQYDEPFELRVHVVPTAHFQPIAPSPYRPYAGGRAVDEPSMFFGRTELLREIVEIVGSGPLGQCVVLYGEARAGKSSVIYQVKRRLPDCHIVHLQLQSITPDVFVHGFVRESLRQLVEASPSVAMAAERLGVSLAEDPIGTLLAVMRDIRRGYDAEQTPRRIVLLIDEFGTVYERIQRGLLDPSFMEQWRGMLESDLFSAVIAGQDSMLEFRRQYWPAFARSHMCHLTYLNASETRELADEPIPHNGKSRYRGRALDRIHELSAGHPFFTQVLCDAIVRVVNAERSTFITERHVERAVHSLARGDQRLSREGLELLLSAANPTRAIDVGDALTSVLLQVVTGTLVTDEDARRESIASEVALLVEKEILTRTRDGRLSIRVKLFEEWLHALAEQEA